MIIIGLAGLKGSGKDTAGNILVEKHGFAHAKFAEPLYRSASALLDIDPDELESFKNDPRARVQLLLPREGTEICADVERSMTVREYLQRYGTEAHRDVFGSSFWTDQLLRKLQAGMFFNKDGAVTTSVVITDARFENECRALTEFSGGRLYYIERDARYGDTRGDEHSSETPPPRQLIYDFIDNRGSLEALEQQMAKIVSSFPDGLKYRNTVVEQRV